MRRIWRSSRIGREYSFSRIKITRSGDEAHYEADQQKTTSDGSVGRCVVCGVTICRRVAPF